MSGDERDVIIGRLAREYGEARQKSAVMKAELASIQKEFAALASALDHNTSAEFNIAVVSRRVREGRLANYDFTKLLEFLEEYSELRKSIAEMASRLKELGIVGT